MTRVRGEWVPIEVLEAEENQVLFSEEHRRDIIAESECGDMWIHVVKILLPEFVRIREDEREWPDTNRSPSPSDSE